MPYKHLFFDLDHTLWDFETNSKETLGEVFFKNQLDQTLTPDFDGFHEKYSAHNKRLWDRYHHGFIKQDELRWKRMWHTLLDYKNGSEVLARQLSAEYLEILPTKQAVFPYTIEILDYLAGKNYAMHLITNGFEQVQFGKLKNSGLARYFTEVITSERAMSLKPRKEIFDFALSMAKAEKAESIMLGDNLDADIKGAMDAGLDTVFVNHINESTSLQPTYTIHHLKELETIF
ncbi:MAG: YjjG family noncanonical pyrimidine nucleotidase [Chitinophagaceae bacterium]